VEELLVRYREEHPELRQLIFRVCTVLGATTNNQITNLFRKRIVLGLTGTEVPFVFIWDEDLVACIVKGIQEQTDGVFNVAGDGVVTLREIARLLHKPHVAASPELLRALLWLLRSLRATQYGPEQVDFLRYRPVLANERLREVFGYVPRRTSREALEYYLEHRQHAR
jgi:UDP-glucose 4-epimerase